MRKPGGEQVYLTLNDLQIFVTRIDEGAKEEEITIYFLLFEDKVENQKIYELYGKQEKVKFLINYDKYEDFLFEGYILRFDKNDDAFDEGILKLRIMALKRKTL